METGKTTTAGRFAAVALLLLVLFVGIIPIIIDQRRMPHTSGEGRPPAISSWPVWPERWPGGKATPPTVQATYLQIARFANRSSYPMAALERTMRDLRAGKAEPTDLYHAAQASQAAAQDERDALVGLVLPPEANSRPAFVDAWRLAQVAALAKIQALEALEVHASDPRPWADSDYLRNVRTAGSDTRRAIALMRSL